MEHKNIYLMNLYFDFALSPKYNMMCTISNNTEPVYVHWVLFDLN